MTGHAENETAADSPLGASSTNPAGEQDGRALPLPEPHSPGSGVGRPAPKLVSIVVPAHNESGNVEVLADRISAALQDQAHELIFVDDGSSDDTFERIDQLAARDSRVCGVRLSRNFGHQYALAAGLVCARGDVVITMDADLQHPPELLPTLIARWREGAFIVHTRRIDNHHVGFLKRTASRMFYRIFSVLCGVPIDPGMADYRLLDRRVVDQVNAMHEGGLLLRAVFRWMGFSNAVVPFEVGKRYSGTPSYNWSKLFRMAINGILSFSTIPLRIGLFVGMITSGLAFLELLYVFITWMRGQTQVPGWASTVGVLSFLFGVLFILLGIQGQYLLRLFERARARPPFIVERIVRQTADSSEDENQS